MLMSSVNIICEYEIENAALLWLHSVATSSDLHSCQCLVFAIISSIIWS